MNPPIAIGLHTDGEGRVHYIVIPWQDVDEGERARYRSRGLPNRPLQAILVGFEDGRHRFEVFNERGDGIGALMERFPSITRSEDRVEYRFRDDNDFFFFKMLWEP